MLVAPVVLSLAGTGACSFTQILARIAPLLIMPFAAEMCIRDRSALVQYWAREAWDYRIGFELLIYNAVFTMAGMLLLAKKNEN